MPCQAYWKVKIVACSVPDPLVLAICVILLHTLTHAHPSHTHTHTPLTLTHTHTPYTHTHPSYSHTPHTHIPQTHPPHTPLTLTSLTHSSHTPHTLLTHTPHTRSSHTPLTHTPHTITDTGVVLVLKAHLLERIIVCLLVQGKPSQAVDKVRFQSVAGYQHTLKPSYTVCNHKLITLFHYSDRGGVTFWSCQCQY